eukprot:gnl/MRDRNA2_/MRDRNA2_107867_c0_seq1.p1 gnl/MRDRNA2_/MRDRNA2_107867_c0~~gnl/MRDRNA2_/MRDRNA2_107867_c0_seq1.p1  ORF type:complete len:384 (+),score=53.75 gnl/MRDRNA2_/MRDRNA2_107867_c0_seq1:51-1202(+)
MLLILLITCAVVADGSRRHTSLRHASIITKNVTAPGVLHLAADGKQNSTVAKLEAQRTRSQEQQCNIIAEFGRAPLMCMQGHARFSRQELKLHVPAFLKFWEQQKQLLPNHCCMGVNHMFALHFLVSKLQPTVIIESGVAAGHQTFMLRTIAPLGARIFSIDPGDPAQSYPNGFPGSHGHWKDTSGYTTYLTGASFMDFAMINWGALIPDPAIRAKTLVILDDHQSCISRIQVLKFWGFKWAFYEDNYPFKVATSTDPYTCPDLGTTITRDFPVDKLAFGDAYSTNAVCGGPLPKGMSSFVIKDGFGTKCKLATPQDQHSNLQYLQQQMQSYFEFPVLYTPCKSPRPPLLDTSTTNLVALGLPSVEGELWHYGHLFPSFIELG